MAYSRRITACERFAQEREITQNAKAKERASGIENCLGRSRVGEHEANRRATTDPSAPY